MTLRTQRSVLAAKIEAVEGTAETLTATEGILALGGSFQRNPEIIPRNPWRPTLSQLASVIGRRTASLSATVEMKGSGTAGTPPEFDALIRACGFGVTNVPTTSDTYAPVSTADPSITAAIFNDGMKQQILGARGSFSFGGAVGEILIANFDFIGVEDSVVDATILAPTYLATVPEPMKNMTFTIHGEAAVFGSSFSIDMGVVNTPRPDFVKESGHASVFMGDRAPVCNFVVEKPLIGTKDWYGDWIAGTEAAISLVLGATGGNIITVTCPKFQIINITEQDDGGKAMLSIDGKLNLSSGDDEIEIEFT